MEVESSMEETDLTSRIVIAIGHGFEIKKEDIKRAKELGIDIQSLKLAAKEMYDVT